MPGKRRRNWKELSESQNCVQSQGQARYENERTRFYHWSGQPPAEEITMRELSGARTMLSQPWTTLIRLLPSCMSHSKTLSTSPVRYSPVRCQISSVGSDFLCIIFATLCLLLPPVVTPVIYSNSILPLDVPEISMPVEGVVGRRIEMPCELKPSRRDESVYMVLWFRGDESIPIYSFDVRGKPFSAAKRWSAEVPFGKRAHFQTSSEVAKLVVEDSKVTDQGIYRCRVDFRNSPSRETRLNLTIIVPPQEPVITEPPGLHPVTELGPYPEGYPLRLRCVVRGGVPSPIVIWYLNEIQQFASIVSQNEREVISEVKVPTLDRSHHRATLACRAHNTLLIQPISKTVTIDMNLRPLTVAIQHRNSQLSTDTQYEIICDSWGSNPAATISWFLDNVKLNTTTEEIRSSNSTTSRLLFHPTASEDGQLLTCRAENPILSASAIEDSWRLRVVYSPILSLRMGSSLNPNDIKEGDDVYFECIIKANPAHEKLSWYHNGELLHHNRTAGVILSNQSLVLQKVTKPSAGNYTCQAMNEQGYGTSKQVRLEIMYAPTCRTDASESAVVIAASRTEDVSISCEMDALPESLKFYWTHTNTVGENTDLAPEIYSSQGSRSSLRYHIRSDEDFGTILCWASNSIGNAERPCVYQLVPADVPQPVENCSIINRTSTSVEITCEAGFDGGLPQTFLLEAYQSYPVKRRGLQYNMSSVSPTFSLSGLDADGTFHFKIYAMNRKGRSSASIMDGIALHYPAMQSAKVRDLKKTTIAIIIGALAAVVVATVALIGFIIHRRNHPITEESDLDKSYSREFRSSRRSSTNDELYHHNGVKKAPDQPTIMEIPFKKPSDFDEDGDPDLIPSKALKGSSEVETGKMYSRLSNGEINQHYGYGGTMEKGSLRTQPVDVPLNSMETNLPPNYATFSRRTMGKANGIGVKGRPMQAQQQREMANLTSSGSFQGKPVVVNIDTRLIGQQLASNQLPESCV